MAYEKQTWNCGDEITAEKLNHMEDGISQSEGGVTVFDLTYDDEADCFATDLSFNDVSNAMANNGVVWFVSREQQRTRYFFVADCYLSGSYCVDLQPNVSLFAENDTDALSSCGGR